jgi:lipopolysaccharide transport system permease protein
MSFLQKHLKYKDLFFNLVSRDIKLKYRRSVLGYLWTILNPLLTLIVMTLVFMHMFRFQIENFPVYLITGQLLFSFMQMSTGRALGSILENASLLKKTFVPKYIFTLSAVTSELINLIFAFLALLVVVLVTKVPFTWYFLLMFVPLIQLYIFCLGIGLFLAQAAVFFRDIQYIWGVLCTAWLYLSAIFYPVGALPDTLQYVITNFNPMYIYITAFRGCILHGSIPLDSYNFTIGAIISIIALIFGALTFNINKNKFILRF